MRVCACVYTYVCMCACDGVYVFTVLHILYLYTLKGTQGILTVLQSQRVEGQCNVDICEFSTAYTAYILHNRAGTLASTVLEITTGHFPTNFNI